MICSLVHRGFRVVKLCFSITLFLNLTLTLNSILSIDTRPVIMQKCQHASTFFTLSSALFRFFFFSFSREPFHRLPRQTLTSDVQRCKCTKDFSISTALRGITCYFLYSISFFRSTLYFYLPFNFLLPFNLSII